MGARKNGARGDTRGKFVASMSDYWQIRFKSEKVRGHREKEIVRRQRFFKYLFPTYLKFVKNKHSYPLTPSGNSFRIAVVFFSVKSK